MIIKMFMLPANLQLLQKCVSKTRWFHYLLQVLYHSLNKSVLISISRICGRFHEPDFYQEKILILVNTLKVTLRPIYYDAMLEYYQLTYILDVTDFFLMCQW